MERGKAHPPEQLCGRAGNVPAPWRGTGSSVPSAWPACQSKASHSRPLPGKGQLVQVSEEWAQQLLGWEGDGGAVPRLLLLPMGHWHQGCPLQTNLKLCT